MTDSMGNTWTDSFSVTVVKVGTELVYYANKFTDSTGNGTYNNGDGTINPGEVIYMDVAIQNTGTSIGLGINAVLSTASSYVTIETAEHEYGSIGKGYYKTAYSAYYSYYAESGYSSSCEIDYKPASGFKFTVSSETPDGTEIPFTLTMTDSMGNTWTDSFSLTVKE